MFNINKARAIGLMNVFQVKEIDKAKTSMHEKFGCTRKLRLHECKQDMIL